MCVWKTQELRFRALPTKTDTVLLAEVESTELFIKAYGAITERDRQWLGEDRFDRICIAKSKGIRESTFYKEVFNFSDDDLVKRKLKPHAITSRFRDILRIPEVNDYVKAVSLDDTPSWTEAMHELRVDAQAVIRQKLHRGANSENPDAATVKLAQWAAEQELGRPIEQHKHTHEIGENFRKAIGDAANRIAGELSDRLGTEEPYAVIDAEVSDLGDGESTPGEES